MEFIRGGMKMAESDPVRISVPEPGRRSSLFSIVPGTVVREIKNSFSSLLCTFLLLFLSSESVVWLAFLASFAR